jgi:hypothetical protein
MKQAFYAIPMLLLFAHTARGYDTETHAWVMQQGYLKSHLAASTLRERLGFARLHDLTPFRISFELVTLGGVDAYLDLTPGGSFGVIVDPYLSSTPYRSPTEFERQRFVYTNGPAASGSSSGLFPTPTKVEAALVRGVVREDDLLLSDHGSQSALPDPDPYGDFRRVANHFYDPANNRALDVGAPCQLTPLGTPCNRSIDWAFGVTDAQSPSFGPLQSRRNHFTWLDARESFWRALTFKSGTPGVADYAARQAQDSGIRRNFWHTSLKSIGHVAHLLQDAAQPQHTRNDRHNPGPLIPFGGTTSARRMMEFYANFRVTGNASHVQNDELPELLALFNGLAGQQLLSVPPIGTYPIPQFSTPVKFFTTRMDNAALAARRGLADYSNRGFYSEGTLPRGAYEFTSPPGDLLDPSFTVGDGVESVVPGFGTVIVQKLYWPVPDPVAPGYIDRCRTNGKLQLVSVPAYSAFAALSSGPLRGGLLALDDYKCHQDALLPRAIAYSAGLINHFFRGELQIEAPPQRVLAVVDQGVPHTVDENGYPRRSDNNGIFGFQKVRLRVRNVTPDIIESGTGNTFNQVLGGSNGPSSGRIVAVARYHRNPCYKPDMSGERRVTMPFSGTFQPPVGCQVVGSRTRYQEISVSAEISVATNEYGSGAASAFVDRTFDFSADPIPVNATDLFIQVVYRGPLGQEPDGIAWGTYDAREPMFVGYWNNSDYFNQNGSWASAAGATGVYRKAVKDFQFCAGAGADRAVLVQYTGSFGNPAMGFPEPAGFMRFAVITAKPVTTENVVIRGNASFFDPQPPVPYLPAIVGVKGTVNQANKERIGLATTPFPLASAPLTDCPSVPPSGTSFLWCVEPVLVRRGLTGGKVAQAIYLENSAGASTPPDAGTLPTFAQAPFQKVGVNLWDEAALTPCPNVLTKSIQWMPEILLLQEELAELEISRDGAFSIPADAR